MGDEVDESDNSEARTRKPPCRSTAEGRIESKIVLGIELARERSL
jgi:hypothetical protein